jgi:hypothetical protein
MKGNIIFGCRKWRGRMRSNVFKTTTDSISSLFGGATFVLAFVDLVKIFEVFLFGFVGGLAGLLGKKIIEHVSERVSGWFDELGYLRRHSLSTRRFWRNTLFIFVLWILAIMVIALLYVVLIIKS